MDHSGQSLIEVLIAVTVVVVVLTALAAGSTRAVSNQIYSSQQAQATKFAVEQMERVRAYRDRNGIDAVTCAAYCNIDINLNKGTPQFVTGNFTIWFSVGLFGASCPDPASSKWIDVFVTWTDVGATKQAKLSTCLSNWRR